MGVNFRRRHRPGASEPMTRSARRVRFAAMKAVQTFTVVSNLPEPPRAAPRGGHEPRVDQRRAGPGPVPAHGPGELGLRARSRPPARHRAPGAPRRAGRPTPPSPPWSRRSATSCASRSTSPAGSRRSRRRSRHRRSRRWPTSPPSSASPPRSPSTPAASACSPATTSRRPTTSACRSPASGSSTTTATSASRLDCRGWQQERFPRLDPRAMAMEPVPDIRITRRHRRHARSTPACGSPTSVASRCTCSTPTSRRTTTSTASSPTGSTAAASRSASARSCCWASAACARSTALGIAARGVPHQRGPRRVPGPRAHPPRHRRRRPVVRARPRPRSVPAGCSRPTPRSRPASTGSRASSWSGTSPTGAGRSASRMDELMELGHEPGTTEGEVFNLAVMSLRLAGQSNGVAKLHGDVSREMFSGIWPDVPVDEVPIGSVTNGVHARTFVSREMSDLLERTVGERLARGRRRSCGRPGRRRPRQRAVDGAAHQPRAAGALRPPAAPPGRPGAGHRARPRWPGPTTPSTRPPSPSASPGASPPTSAPTCCCATSTASRPLLLDEDRPMQIIVAGKAHPADDPGKELLQRVATFATDLDLRHRLVFLEDYDISVARMLVAGVDVWLNTPLRPLEACGTSGMKAAFNGVLNCSILDGWWDEMYDADVGWAIPSAEWQDDQRGARRDRGRRASSTCSSARSSRSSTSATTTACPTEWLRRVKACLSPLGPQVEASRMLKEYTTRLLRAGRRPQRRRCAPTTTSGPRRSSAGSATIFRGWPSVAVHTDLLRGAAGRARRRPTGSTAQVSLGDLEPSDVEVQLIYGRRRPRRRPDRPGPACRWQRTATATCPGWHRYVLRHRVRPGRQLRVHRAHRARPPRPAPLRAPRPGGVGAGGLAHRLTPPPKPPAAGAPVGAN